jgi:putative ABC transport system substrate-binding protein
MPQPGGVDWTDVNEPSATLVVHCANSFQALSKYLFQRIECSLLSLGANMRRREFITLVGGTAVAWPLLARAQQANRRVGALILGNADAQSFEVDLREGLRKRGYVEGQNIQYEFRSADGNIALLSKLAAELVALRADVIVALYTPCSLAAKQATREIPIVTVSGDPVGFGLVASLARPGGNITGISMIAAELAGKSVELLRDALPGLRRVAALGNAADPFSKPFIEQVRFVGKSTGIEITPEIMVLTPDEIDAAFAAMKKEGAGGVAVQGSLASNNTAELALKHRLPTATVARSFAEAGALMSYGPDARDLFRRAADIVAKVLQGAHPADLPVEQPTKFELVVNLKTAKAFGLTIPESFLLRADEVID